MEQPQSQSRPTPGSLLVEDVVPVTGRGRFPVGSVQGVLHRGDAVEVLRGDGVLLHTVILGLEFLTNRAHPHWVALRLEEPKQSSFSPGTLSGCCEKSYSFAVNAD